MDEASLVKLSEYYEANSKILADWALLILGGSIFIILSKEHFKPHLKSFKYFYLLFIPGWVLLTISIYCYNCIARIMPVIQITADGEGTETVNIYYYWQLMFFNIALGIFSIWLAAYLIWWVFFSDKKYS